VPFTECSGRKLAADLACGYRHVQPGTGLVGVTARRVVIGAGMLLDAVLQDCGQFAGWRR
jgi:hypothetical protein